MTTQCIYERVRVVVVDLLDGNTVWNDTCAVRSRESCYDVLACLQQSAGYGGAKVATSLSSISLAAVVMVETSYPDYGHVVNGIC